MIDQEILSKIKPGARIRVFEKIKEGDKERIGRFEGIVIARKHGNEAGATFTLRGSVAAVGVEKVYPIYSPIIHEVQIMSSPKKVHRAKLYYIRDISRKKLRNKLGL